MLHCAVLCCVVGQAILGTPTLSELIWILSSSCLRAWFTQSWLQSKRVGRSTSSNTRSVSAPKWDEPIKGRSGLGLREGGVEEEEKEEEEEEEEGGED